MTTPAVVEKELKDINLNGGVNERDRPEILDWTKYLTTAENLVWEQGDSLVKRGGIVQYGSSTVDDASQTSSCRRLFSTGDSFLNVNDNFYVQQPDEGTASYVNKGLISEISVRPVTVDAGAEGASGVYASPAVEDTNGYVLDTAISSKYMFMARTYLAQAINQPVITVVDRSSGQEVRRYVISFAASTTSDGVTLSVVDDTHLHVFYSTGGVAVQRYNIISLASLPVSGLITVATGSLPSTGAGRRIVQSKAVSGFSLVTLTDGTDSWVDKISTTGSSTAGSSIATYVVSGGDVTATQYILVGLDATPSYVVKKVTISSLAVASTVTDGVLVPGNYTKPRLAVDSSGNMRMIVFGNAATVTAGVDCPTANIYSMTSAGTAFTLMGSLAGCQELAHPFCHTATSRMYAPIVKVRQNVSGAALVTDQAAVSLILDVTAVSGTTLGAGTWRPVALLDNYTARSTGASVTNGRRTNVNIQSVDYSSNVAVIAVEEKAGAITRGYELCELVMFDATSLSYAGGVISGGLTSFSVNSWASECGFVDAPSVYLVDSGGGVGPGAGTYNYVAVFGITDTSGNVHYSRVSAVSSIVMAGGNAPTVQFTTPRITARYFAQGRTISVSVYRTTNGGTQYFLQSVTDSTTTSNLTSITDTTSDATLATRPLLYRQPGTAATPLDRYPPLATAHACSHKDRVFVCRKGNVYYSSFLVDGEAPWFNPAFTFPVPGGSANITAMASMDGQLVIFKRDGIWVVDGDGPPENGGSGTEFSPPRRIMTEYGCVDQRTVVATSVGLMYRSTRGLELLTRSGQVVWVGQMVQNTVDANPENGGACFDRLSGRVLFVLAATAGTYPGQASYAGTGVVLSYDLEQQGWTVLKRSSSVPLQDVIFTRLLISGSNSERVVYGAQKHDLYESATSYQDVDDILGTNFVPFKLETGWIKYGSPQDRMRVSDFLLMAKKITNHNLKISVAYDYSSSYTYTKTWTPADINPLALEQLELQIPRQAVMAVRIKVEDEIPADVGTYPVTTGRGPEILALTVKVGLRGGGAKLASTQKG